MDDAELTRLAIAEIVREMSELKDAPLQERKINPIAKPNKRFLGRTINSMMSHNKRENDRTQENCRKKLRELDERHEKKYSKGRSSSRELILSSSTDEDQRRGFKKRRKKRKKSSSRKHKKDKKGKSKTRKRKSKRRDSSCSSSSSESSNSSSTSGSSSRSRSLKTFRYKKALKEGFNAEEEQTYYEHNMNAALELDAALMVDSYRQHQIQQLMLYSALIAGRETVQINTMQEELQMSDVDFTEPQLDNKSISSAVSSSNLEDGDSESSEILQISLSSASSTSSKDCERKSLRRKRAKRKEHPKGVKLMVNEEILELDSDSSVDSDRAKEAKQAENDEYICIDSETENHTATDTDTNEKSDSDSSNSGAESQTENMTNDVCHAAVDTVTLLSSSDSEVEIVTIHDAEAAVQERHNTDSALISTCQIEKGEEEKVETTSTSTPVESSMTTTLSPASPNRPTLSCIEQRQQTDIILGREMIAEVNSLVTEALPGSATICSAESKSASDATGKSDETKEGAKSSIQSAIVMGDPKCELVPENTMADKFKLDSSSNSPIISKETADISNEVVIETITLEESRDTSNSPHLSTSFVIKNDLILTLESCTSVSPIVCASKSETAPASTLLSIDESSQVGDEAKVLPSFTISSESDLSSNSSVEILKSPQPTLEPATPIVTESNSVNIKNENNAAITTLDNSPVLCHSDNN